MLIAFNIKDVTTKGTYPVGRRFCELAGSKVVVTLSGAVALPEILKMVTGVSNWNVADCCTLYK